MPAIWDMLLSPIVEVSCGRRQFTYEIIGTDVDMSDYIEINTKAHKVPDICTMSYFTASADGVALLQPILMRSPVNDPTSMQYETRTKVPATKINNQPNYKLKLYDKKLFIKPNADTDGLTIRLSFVLVEGHY